MQRFASLALAALLAASVLGARAGSFSVSPVRIDLTTERNVAVVQLSNTGERPLAVQAVATHWPADAAAVTELVVNPPIASIAPGQTQTIRIGLRERASSATERAFRVYFTELPAPHEAAGAMALGMTLRVGVPVFVAPQRAEPRELQFRVAGAEVEVHNPGNVHRMLGSVQLRNGERATTLQAASPYLLAGQTTRLPLHDFALERGRALTLVVDGPGGRVERSVGVD